MVRAKDKHINIVGILTVVVRARASFCAVLHAWTVTQCGHLELAINFVSSMKYTLVYREWPSCCIILEKLIIPK